jgi:hypothetical protein
MEADSSIWQKPGHFYFALTRAMLFRLEFSSPAEGCQQSQTTFYSPRRATMGSTRMARRAGM